MKGYHVYSKIQQFRSAGFSQRQVARRLGINRKTVKRYWEMPVDEYEEMSSTVCRMQYLDKYQARILEWLREFPDLTAAQPIRPHASPWCTYSTDIAATTARG